MLSSRTDYPLGHPRYWPIFEAAVAYDLPLGFHVGGNLLNPTTACGSANYYFEDHVGVAYDPYGLVPSLIFEGVFDRFPRLKIALAELGWSWAPSLCWRMDAAMRVMGDEVAHLERTPSEYFRDHFWLTTQPIDEPERPQWFTAIYDQLAQIGMADRLVFSSDYPHWDFDSPRDALPRTLPESIRRKILGENASALYDIALHTPRPREIH
jgi:predicted TIM-barrel fold metal-dependent hydrolase